MTSSTSSSSPPTPSPSSSPATPSIASPFVVSSSPPPSTLISGLASCKPPSDSYSTASVRRYGLMLMLMHPLMGSKMGRHMLFDYKLVGGGGGRGGGVGLLLRCLRDHGRKEEEKKVGNSIVCSGRRRRRKWAITSSAGAAEKVLAEEAEEWGESGKELAREMGRVLICVYHCQFERFRSREIIIIILSSSISELG